MAYEARAVANFILDLSDRDGIPVDPMKLQKLIYFAHGWHLGLLGEPLINERIEAWEYGPVIPSVYHEFKRFGRSPISGRAVDFDPVAQIPSQYKLPRTAKSHSLGLIERVWEVYKKLSGVQLSKMTHEAGMAWHRVWEDQNGKRFQSVSISDEEITKDFKKAG